MKSRDLARAEPEEAKDRENSKSHGQPLALSANDIARMLSVSVRTIRQWDNGGQLGPMSVKLSDRCSRWDAAEIREWWAACHASGRRIGRQEWVRIREKYPANRT